MKLHELIEMLEKNGGNSMTNVRFFNPVYNNAFNYREDEYEVADVYYYNTHNENELIIEIKLKNQM